MALGHDFLDMIPRAQTTKSKKKWEYIKLKNFCTAKGTINQIKRQPTQ